MPQLMSKRLIVALTALCGIISFNAYALTNWMSERGWDSVVSDSSMRNAHFYVSMYDQFKTFPISTTCVSPGGGPRPGVATCSTYYDFYVRTGLNKAPNQPIFYLSETVNGKISYQPYVVWEGYFYDKKYIKANPRRVPGANAGVSCQTSRGRISQAASFMTGGSMGFSVSEAISNATTNGKDFKVEGGGDITVAQLIKLGTKVSFGWNESTTVTGTTTETRAWTDYNQYTNTSTNTQTIAPAFIGVPKIEQPVAIMTGFFKVRALSPGGGAKPRATQPPYGDGGWYYPLYATKYLAGTLAVATDSFDSLRNSNPVWFIDQQRMTVAQYRKYCKSDFVTHNYAPWIKQYLCNQGIDRAHSCKKWV